MLVLYVCVCVCMCVWMYSIQFLQRRTPRRPPHEPAASAYVRVYTFKLLPSSVSPSLPSLAPAQSVQHTPFANQHPHPSSACELSSGSGDFLLKPRKLDKLRKPTIHEAKGFLHVILDAGVQFEVDGSETGGQEKKEEAVK